MRVIGGEFRSRVLRAPDGMATRPTSDRLRETLFNVLAARIAGARFLDLYAGSGAVGIEALSRGAAHAAFVERAGPAVKVLRANLARLGIDSGFSIHAGTVGAFLAGPRSDARQFDVAFLDPPYESEEEYEKTLGLLGGEFCGFLAAGAVVVAEHRRNDELEDQHGALKRTRLLRQGDAALSFFERN